MAFPMPFLMYKSSKSLICLVQPWYLHPCPTNPNFLSLQLSVRYLVDERLLPFDMRVVKLELWWPAG